MRAVKNSRSSRGVRKVAKIGKERLAHRGGPKTLLLALHIGVSHGLHHLGLRLKGLECPKWVHKVRPENRRLGRASANAFTRGAFCAGQVLLASQGQGLFASAAPWDACRDKGIQEIPQEELAPRLRPWFSVLAAIAFCKIHLFPCINQPCAKGGLESKTLRWTLEVRLACSRALSVSNQINFVPMSLESRGQGDPTCMEWVDVWGNVCTDAAGPCLQGVVRSDCVGEKFTGSALTGSGKGPESSNGFKNSLIIAGFPDLNVGGVTKTSSGSLWTKQMQQWVGPQPTQRWSTQGVRAS